MTEDSADAFLPEDRSLRSLAEAVQRCEGCDLYRNATQAVFGEGTKRAHVMFVGEQPGDREDVEGHPFVGPAGGVLDRGLEAAGISRADAYVTNIVKHFKWTPAPRGKRQIHKKPDLREQRQVGIETGGRARGHGWRRSSNRFDPRSSCASARRPRSRCSAGTSG